MQPFMQGKGGYFHLTDAENQSLGTGDLSKLRGLGTGFLIWDPFHDYYILFFSGFFMKYRNKLLKILEKQMPTFFLIKIEV